MALATGKGQRLGSRLLGLVFCCLAQTWYLVAAPPPDWTRDTVFVFPQAGRAPWLRALDRAEKSIAVAAYKLADPQIIAALNRARGHGVKITVLAQPEVFKHGQSLNAVSPLAAFRAAGIRVRTLSQRFNQAHYKMLIVDDRWGLISTGNLDSESFDGLPTVTPEPCRDFAVPILERSTIAEMKRIFTADIQDRRVVPNHPRLVWGPDQQRGTFLRLINSARSQICIYQQDFQDVGIARAVAGAARSGVAVKLIMMPFPFGTNEDKNRPNQARIAAAGGQVRLNRRNYIHAKVLMVDGKEMYIGSCNFYPDSIDQTRELGILIRNPKQIRTVRKTFDQDWDRSSPIAPPPAAPAVAPP